MSGPVVLDACALIALALDEKGSDVVLEHMRCTAYIHAINAFEVAVKLMGKTISEEDAWSAAAFGGVQCIDDVGYPLRRRAARLKSVNTHLSLGDCFCLALAEELYGSVVTSDGGFSTAKTTAQVIRFR